MSELIGIREAARRLGVSDTAVHKAIKAGRVHIASRTEKSGRPLVAWPQTQDDWLANSDAAKRSHVGSRGSPRREADPEPAMKLKTNMQPEEVQQAEGIIADGQRVSAAPSYAQSRAIREAYQARLSKLEFEEKSGRLVEIEKVKAEAFKVARMVRDGLLNLPDRISHELAHETDPARAHKLLSDEIRMILTGLSGRLDLAGQMQSGS
jgi:hypothetical protein